MAAAQSEPYTSVHSTRRTSGGAAVSSGWLDVRRAGRVEIGAVPVPNPDGVSAVAVLT